MAAWFLHRAATGQLDEEKSMPVPKDTTGRVVAVRDALDGIGTSLRYTNYQLDAAGPGREPHPWCWTESSGLMRGVFARQAQLAEHLARTIDRWAKANPGEDPANLAAMKQAAKDYRAAARSLTNLGRKMRNVQSCLELTSSLA